MMEECDHLSTVSMLSDIDCGYGGLAALVAQFVREESKSLSMVGGKDIIPFQPKA